MYKPLKSETFGQSGESLQLFSTEFKQKLEGKETTDRKEASEKNNYKVDNIRYVGKIYGIDGTSDNMSLITLKEDHSEELFYGYCVDIKTAVDASTEYHDANNEEIEKFFPLEKAESIKRIINCGLSVIKDTLYSDETSSTICEVVSGIQMAIWTVIYDYEFIKESTDSQNALDVCNILLKALDGDEINIVADIVIVSCNCGSQQSQTLVLVKPLR